MKSHVAIGRKPVAEGKSEVFLMISNAQHKQGLKYLLLDNVETVFTRLLHEGRTTIRQAGASVVILVISVPDPDSIRSVDPYLDPD